MSNRFPIFQSKPKMTAVEIDNADGTALQSLFTAGATNGALIDNIAVTTDDTSDVTIVVTVYDGSADFTVGEVVIPAGSGTDGSNPAVNLLDADALPFLQANGGLPLGPSDILKVNAKAAVTATKVVHLVAFGGDY